MTVSNEGTLCWNCPINHVMNNKRCCQKNNKGWNVPREYLTFRPRVIRLLTEWLAAQERENHGDNLHNQIMNIGINSISISAAISACTREDNTWAKRLQLAYEFGYRDW